MAEEKYNSKGYDAEAKVLPSGHDAAAHALEEMGYKQEMTRSLGMMAVLGLAFSIMAVPVGRVIVDKGCALTVVWNKYHPQHCSHRWRTSDGPLGRESHSTL